MFNVNINGTVISACQGSNFIAAIAVEGERNAVDFFPYSAIFILFRC